MKGRNPRPALSPLADSRFTRGVDVLTAYSREIHPLRPGSDSWRRHARRRRLEHPQLFTVEPGIYIPNLRGVRVEENAVVTKDGVDVLTGYTKELRSLGPGAALLLKETRKTTKTGMSFIHGRPQSAGRVPRA